VIAVPTTLLVNSPVLSFFPLDRRRRVLRAIVGTKSRKMPILAVEVAPQRQRHEHAPRSPHGAGIV